MADPPASPAGSASPTASATVPLVLLVGWLLLAVPVFLRMPLTNDAELFDLHVRMLDSGRTLYADILEPNLPGVIWIHAAVRSLMGESPEALRLFDLLMFSGLMILVYRWLLRSGSSRSGSIATVLSASVFYLSGSEWIHCQRDMWMLAVTFVAASVRCRLLEQEERDLRRTGAVSVAEGLIWGIGIWIKPYVVIVAIAVWAVTARRHPSVRKMLADGLSVLAGGLIAGACGLTWMAWTGCLMPFLQQSQEWNPHYFAARLDHWTLDRLIPMVIRFLPWVLLHAVAVPVAVMRLKTSVRNFPAENADPQDRAATRSEVLAAIYVAWCLHMTLLQHLFDYVHAPGVTLAIVMTADWVGKWRRRAAAKLASYVFALAVLLICPYLAGDRLGHWKIAVFENPTAETRDELACFSNPSRQAMEKVADFLRSQNIGERDVVCFNSDLVSLYRRIERQPPSRFIYVDQNVAYVPAARGKILQELMDSGHRFVVADALSSGLPAGVLAELPGDGPVRPPQRLAAPAGLYPWGQPVVFRAGTYLVHRISGEPDSIHAPGDPLTPAEPRGKKDR